MSINLQLLRLGLMLLILIFGYDVAYTQEYRTYSGEGNNQINPSWNSTGDELAYITGNGYFDGISSPSGIARPNPRVISNILFDQTDILVNEKRLSDFIWVFGQFIDHDISIVDDDQSAFLPINVPFDDQYFESNTVIPMARSLAIEGSGTSVENFRKVANAISGWLDGSNIYGSDIIRANWLRTFISGKLKTSLGNLPPFNTKNGEFNSTVDDQAPSMANPINISSKYYVVGDVRGNENVLLTSFHTLFLREHNRQCDIIKDLNPGFTNEEIYQKARRNVGAILQSITYNEWLPAMGIELDEYDGYDELMDPRISNVFSAAAYRWGHSLVGSEIIRIDNNGETLPVGNLELKNAFFNPLSIIESQGIEPLLKGMGTKMHQEMDCKVVSDIRNFLFGDPSAGGLDLAAINIMRGRERGLKDFNGVRVSLGLAPYTEWKELVADSEVQAIMEKLYNQIDNIDPWVGMLAENHMPDALFGETVMFIMKQQFTALRDGDRFYYENDPDLSMGEKEEFATTKLYDLLMRNTDIKLMQENVFLAKPHENIPGANISVLERNLDFSLFPNPVENDLFFKVFLDFPSTLEFAVVDNRGKAVYSSSQPVPRGKSVINALNDDMNISSGFYLLRITDGIDVGYQPFIKQ